MSYAKDTYLDTLRDENDAIKAANDEYAATHPRDEAGERIAYVLPHQKTELLLLATAAHDAKLLASSRVIKLMLQINRLTRTQAAASLDYLHGLLATHPEAQAA